MSPFLEALAAVFNAETLPENAHDSLVEAYELDNSTYTAKTETLQNELEAARAEIAALKVRMYDLIHHGNVEHEEPGDDDDQPDEDETIEDLFTSEEN